MLIFTKAVAEDIGPIREPIELVFDPHVNVFIGPNSSGKSTILRALQTAQAVWDFDGPYPFDDVEDEPLKHTSAKLSLPEGDGTKVFQVDPGPLPHFTVRESFDYVENGVSYLESFSFRRIYVPAARIPYPLAENALIEQASRLADIDHLRASSVVLDGRSIGVDINNLAENIHSSLDQFVYDDPFEDPDEHELERNRRFLQRCVEERTKSIAETVYACAREICPEVLANVAPSSAHFVDSRAQGLTFSQHYGSYQINDSLRRQITLGDLSSGTQGPLLMIWHIALTLHEYALEASRGRIGGFGYRLLNRADRFDLDALPVSELPEGFYLQDFMLDPDDTSENGGNALDSEDPLSVQIPWRDVWRQLPFVLLIDEIENHLHPTWQRRIIPTLLNHFPNVQIFATTHSPFVVAGLKAGQVHLLNRDANGVVTASTNTEDIVGWTADEILRTMMGVQDPTDDETARNAAELRRLRDEGPRDTADAEEQRLTRMQELRRLVDRDLLAGGPAAAQRELFEQQFAEALENYRQSRELGQENG